MGPQLQIPNTSPEFYCVFTILFCFPRFSKMPCCCKDNVQASFVIGIVLAILSLINCVEYSPLNIALGIVGALIHCILIFGAYKRHRTAILGRFKIFFPLYSFCNYWRKWRKLFRQVLYCLSLVFLFPSCCLSFAFLLLFSCFFQLAIRSRKKTERQQKDNIKSANTILSIFAKNYRK